MGGKVEMKEEGWEGEQEKRNNRKFSRKEK